MNSAATTSQALEITATKEAPLSKNQKEFNRLTAKIEKLRLEISKEEEKYESLLQVVGEFLIPANEAVAKAKLKLAATLDQGAMDAKFSKPQMKEIGSCIRDLCQAAFTCIVPSDEDKALYDRWSRTSYDEEVEEQEADEKDMMEWMMSSMFGMDVDIDELKDDPEAFFKFQEEFERKREQGFGGERKKTKSQQKAADAREAKIKAAEELKSKSVRSVYISLAKLIHPDMETDHLQRAVKEEEMKKLTSAYEQNDLATLLKMEIEWIHKQNDHLGSIPEDKLALFVQVLKDQVDELEGEKMKFRWDERFAMVQDYARGQKETGIRKIKSDARIANVWVMDIEREARSIKNADPKRGILPFVKDYLRSLQVRFF